MAEGPYRDPLAAIRERVSQLEAEVERRESRVSPMDLALVPEDVAVRVEELRARAAPAPEPALAAWTEREAVLESLVLALGEAESLAPALELAADAPLPPESSDPRPFLMDELRQQRLRRQVDAELSTRAREVRCTRWSDEGYLWTFELERIRFSLYGTARLGSFAAEVTRIDLTLRVSVPVELGPLVVAPPGVWSALFGASHTLDPEFHRHFRVAGPARQAPALLGEELRALLIAVHHRSPRLEVRDGVAALAWQLEDIAFDEPTFHVTESTRALVALRRAL